MKNLSKGAAMQKRYFLSYLLVLVASIFIVGGCSTLPVEKVMHEKYPENPITLIVPFSAGGGMDLQARILEKIFPKYIKEDLIIVNKTGGGGTIGWNELISSSPDGYTLGMTATEILMQPLVGETKYHYATALEPIAQISSTPHVLISNIEYSSKNINELVQYMKENPGELKFGYGGIGSISHIFSECFDKRANVNTQKIPFHGGSEVIGSLLGNHVQLAFVNIGAAKEQLQSGKVHALAITGEQRLTDPLLSQIPTLRESGIDIALTVWYGIAVPKETPAEIKEKLAGVLEKISQDPEFKENTEKLGLRVDYLNAEDSKDKWASEMEDFLKMLKETGIDQQIREQKK